MGRLKGLDKSNRQKGMALIIAIGFLAVLSILGVTVLTLTNRELKVVADIKPASLAFYVADSAVEYSMNPMLRKYMGRAGNNPIDLMTDSAIGEGEVPLAGGETHRDVIEDGFSTMPTNIKPEMVSGQVENLSSNSPVPPQLEGLFTTDYRSALYQVDVTTKSAEKTARISAAIADMYNTAGGAHGTVGLGPDGQRSGTSGAGGGS